MANTIEFLLPSADLSPQSKLQIHRFSRFYRPHDRKSLYFAVGTPIQEFPLSMGDLDPI